MLIIINLCHFQKTVPEIHVPKVDCFVCGEPVSMDEIAQHQQTHHPDPAPLPAAKVLNVI